MNAEQTYLTLKHVVASGFWEEHSGEVRKHLHRELGDRLIEWIADNGSCIVGGIEEMSVVATDSFHLGMTEVRLRLSVYPVGPLVGEFYFHGGPADGRRMATDGGSYWRLIVSGEPVSLSAYAADGPIAAASVPPLVAAYVRTGDYYRFAGYDR